MDVFQKRKEKKTLSHRNSTVGTPSNTELVGPSGTNTTNNVLIILIEYIHIVAYFLEPNNMIYYTLAYKRVSKDRFSVRNFNEFREFKFLR